MTTSKRKRYGIVAGIIVIVIAGAVALLSVGNAEKVMSIAEAASPDSSGKRVQVTGNVVDDSFTIQDDVLTFAICDAENPQDTLTVVYDKGVAATFGNGVTAICSGAMDDSGVLRCSELVTKCPSKYETATDALSVARLLGYGEEIWNKPVKVQGLAQEGSWGDVTSQTRLVLVDQSDPSQVIPVSYSGALPDEATGGGVLVLTGSLSSDGSFLATDIALEA